MRVSRDWIAEEFLRETLTPALSRGEREEDRVRRICFRVKQTNTAIMLDFEIQRCTRKCFATERELRPGETFYSALVQQGAEVVRRDYSEAAWSGPPEGAIGFWKSQLPGATNKKRHWAPNDVMLHYFEQLAETPDKLDVRYVLALLMVRRRVLRQESLETDEQGREVAVLFCPKNEQEYRTPVVMPDAGRVEQIQNELAQLLYADA